MSYLWPSFSKAEISEVKSVLRSGKVNYWTGEQNKKFEKEFAKFCQSKYAISLANGTLALDLALKALNVGNGDEVIVTCRTYVASVSCIANSGAKPIFADVHPETQNITAQSIKPLITAKTKAIICVHLSGWPCDMDPILALAKKFKIFVIEDCAQAHGAFYKGNPVGSIGDIGCWSFCNDKIMTTGGEGGMVTTNNKKLWLKMWSYKDHGKSWHAVFKRKHPNRFKWLHESFGSNFRMTEMQAAIGRIQLKKLLSWNEKRRKNMLKIWNTAKSLPNLKVSELSCEGCTSPCSSKSKCIHAAYKCYIFVRGNQKLRNNILNRINKMKIPCFTGSCPEVYLEKAFKKNNLQPSKRLHNAKVLGNTSLMFLCHPTLTKKEIENICDALRMAAKAYS